MNPSIYGNDAQGAGSGKLVPLGKTRELERVIDALPAMPQQGFGALTTQVEQVRSSTRAPITTMLRRLLFVWLRVYVHETKRGKASRVNVGIPIPIPVVGAIFRNKLTWNQALKAVSLAQDTNDGAKAIGRYLESCMALEFVRVEEESVERGKKTLVVIGLD